MALSPRFEEHEKTNHFYETSRQVGNLGKNAYALAFGGSDLSKILINNKGSKVNPHDGQRK